METVILENGTTGQTENGKVGDIVTVTLCDENGLPIKATGKIVEILDQDVDQYIL